MKQTIRAVLEQVLSKFPTNETIKALLPDDNTLGYRVYKAVASDDEIIRWRKVLEETIDDNSKTNQPTNQRSY
jgi:hypothetical protein